MDVDSYLQRIGLSERPRPDLDGLRSLHRAHLLSIPYENMDVQLGRPVSLERPQIFDKIVGTRRGGWCYEMNGLLGWALAELGFRVTRATGAVMRNANGDASIGNHLVLKVELQEGIFLADVGFSDGPLDPIHIAAGRFASNGFEFGIDRLDEQWWRLRNHPMGGADSFDFNLDPADESVLAARCHWLQTSPDSKFVQNAFCIRHVPGGIVQLRGRVLRRIRGVEASERILSDERDFVATLRDLFGLDIPGATGLWPKICARHEFVMAAPPLHR